MVARPQTKAPASSPARYPTLEWAHRSALSALLRADRKAFTKSLPNDLLQVGVLIMRRYPGVRADLRLAVARHPG
jgi:hypothetical protein